MRERIEMALRLLPWAPEGAAIARLQQADFGFETTLAGRGHLNLIRGLKRRGYEVHFFYLWLPSVELAISRVKERVLRGGHEIETRPFVGGRAVVVPKIPE